MELKWYCAFCDQYVTDRITGSRLPFRESPAKAAARRLLAKVDDHIDFHAWQFDNEIDSMWLEEQEQDDE